MRVAIFDDQRWMIDAVRQSLDLAGHEVVLVARSGRELLAGLDPQNLPDVVILDKATAGNRREGLDTAAGIRAAHPGVGIVLISQDLAVADAEELMGLPGDGLGVISKGAISDHASLTTIVSRVAGGGSLVEPGLRRQMVEHARRFAVLDALTPREEETLDLIAEGLPNSEIAHRLGRPGEPVSVRTVESFCAGIYQKLGLTSGRQNRMQAGTIWVASARRPHG